MRTDIDTREESRDGLLNFCRQRQRLHACMSLCIMSRLGQLGREVMKTCSAANKALVSPSSSCSALIHGPESEKWTVSRRRIRSQGAAVLYSKKVSAERNP